jgi:hypothetical protein
VDPINFNCSYSIQVNVEEALVEALQNVQELVFVDPNL